MPSRFWAWAQTAALIEPSASAAAAYRRNNTWGVGGLISIVDDFRCYSICGELGHSPLLSLSCPPHVCARTLCWNNSVKLQMDPDKIRRPKSQARKKSECRSPNALCQRLGNSHGQSQMTTDKNLVGRTCRAASPSCLIQKDCRPRQARKKRTSRSALPSSGTGILPVCFCVRRQNTR